MTKYSFFLQKINIFIIRNTALHIDLLKEYFQKEEVIPVKSIFDFYRTLKQSIQESTINCRIHELVSRGVLQRTATLALDHQMAKEIIEKKL